MYSARAESLGGLGWIVKMIKTKRETGKRRRIKIREEIEVLKERRTVYPCYSIWGPEVSGGLFTSLINSIAIV